MIVSVLNQKGGTGKTTLSINLAYFFQEKLNKNVLLVDADPQASARDWNAINDGAYLTVIGLDKESLKTDVLKFKNLYDCIIIDGAGKLKNQTVAAIRASEFVLIPVQPSPYDVWATHDLVTLIEMTKETGKQIEAYFVLNSVITNTNQKTILEGAIKEMSLPRIPSFLSHRVAFADCAIDGGTIYQSGNKVAIAELERVGHDVAAILWGQKDEKRIFNK